MYMEMVLLTPVMNVKLSNSDALGKGSITVCLHLLVSGDHFIITISLLCAMAYIQYSLPESIFIAKLPGKHETERFKDSSRLEMKE